MKLSKTILLTCLSLFSATATSQEIVINGVVSNADQAKSNPEITAYMPGTPLIENQGQEWNIITKGFFHPSTGIYGVTLNVPDGYNGKIILSATYLDTSYDKFEAHVTTHIDTSAGGSPIVNFDLAGVVNEEVGFKLRVFQQGNEYDYTNSYRCVIGDSDYNANGRLFVLNNFDYSKNENIVRGVPAGEYKVACYIKNLTGLEPKTLKRVMSVVLPLVDGLGNAPAEDQRFVDFKFDGVEVDGVGF